MSAASRCDGCGRYAAAEVAFVSGRVSPPVGWLIVEWWRSTGGGPRDGAEVVTDRGEFCSARCASGAVAEFDLAKLVGDG